MSPQEITAATALLQTLGNLPIGALIVVVFVLPWIALLIFTWFNQRMIREFRDQFWEETKEARQRFEVIVRMYENSSVLVKNYEKLCRDQQDIIISNTQKLQQLNDRLGT